MKDELTHEYDDIISLPYHQSVNHPRMGAMERAAQFSPFAALTGHSEAIKETERLTEERMVLSDDRKEYLDERLCRIMEGDSFLSDVSLTYFVPDERKEGGEYRTATGRISRVDTWKREIVMEDGTEVPMGDISDIEGEIFLP